MARVSIVTLGCPKNAIDSEGLGGLLAAGGHTVVEEPVGAEVVLVNTCGFIDPARRETIQEALDLAELKQTSGLKGLVLTGCLVARAAGELEAELPEVDALVDFAAYPRIASIVEDVAHGRLDTVVQGTPGTRFDPAYWDATIAASPRLRFGRAPWAYVKIAEGCDRGCTFCAIPLMRGKLRSRTPETIETEIRLLVSQGVSEISLVSQDSVMWGRDIGAGDFESLLARLERIEDLKRLRLMYLHPQGVTDALIDRMAASDVIVSYFDLSLQHVAPNVLKRMGRWGGRDRFEKMIARIRGLDPLAAIRSTFILGFPGESDSEACDVKSFVEDTDLDWIGTFTYSPEEGTRSHELDGRVPEEVARERTDRVEAAAQLTMSARAETYVGRELEVLVERFDLEEQTWIGRSHREAPEIDGEIRLENPTGLKVGIYANVGITRSDGADLIARTA